MAAKKKTKTAKKPATKSKKSKKAVSAKSSSKPKSKVSTRKKVTAKASPRKAAARKATARKPAAKKPVAKKAAAAKKPAARKRAISFTKPVIRTGPSIAPRPFAHLFPANKVRPLPKTGKKSKPPTKKEIAVYKDLLLKFRDRVIDEISFLANDNLNRNAKESSGDLSSYSFHMADQGTDNYDREFAASLLNSEHDVLYEIEEALRRIEQGTYGICEISEQPIERERLKVLPFARYCVSVQSEIERGKPRHQPFRRQSIQSAEPSVSSSGND